MTLPVLDVVTCEAKPESELSVDETGKKNYEIYRIVI
jgi:hypothetical protein